jgi:dTMP kinase
VAEALGAQGIVVCATREPGGTPLAEEIRQLALARRSDGMPPTTELLLMFAARAAHVSQRLEPALSRGEWVLCDRFTDASRAYQGGGRGLDEAVIDQLAAIAHPRLQPDLTFLLDLSPEAGLARARSRKDNGDRFEDEALAFFARVRARYLQLAAREPARFRVLDATRTPAELLAAAMHELAPA